MASKKALSLSKVKTNTMIPNTLKPHTNANTVRGRPTLKDVERFRTGSPRELYERSIYERIFMSEPIENHAVANELSDVNRKEHPSKHRSALRRDREPSRIPVRTLKRPRNKDRTARELAYKCIRSSTPESSKMRCFIKVRKHQNTSRDKKSKTSR